MERTPGRIAENLKAVGCPEADRFIRRKYREGWSLFPPKG